MPNITYTQYFAVIGASEATRKMWESAPNPYLAWKRTRSASALVESMKLIGLNESAAALLVADQCNQTTSHLTAEEKEDLFKVWDTICQAYPSGVPDIVEECCAEKIRQAVPWVVLTTAADTHALRNKFRKGA